MRPGAPPGAADWTHQYADAGNTVCSADRLVRAPLGLLWYGGPSNDDVLPRHGHGPAPQVSRGRLFIEGPQMLRAVDIYTGRLLWQKTFPNLGAYYDHTNHQPGANEIGSNYATSKDRVYLVLGSSIFELDAADGHLRREFRLQGDPGATPVYGGFVAVWENLLVVTTQAARYASASPRLMVYDLQTGRTLWNRPAKYGFRHNAIAVGGGRIFVIDALPGAVLAMMKRRGEKPGTASGFPRPKDTEAVPGPGTGTKRLSQNGQGHVGRSPNVEVTNGLGIGTKKPTSTDDEDSAKKPPMPIPKLGKCF